MMNVLKLTAIGGKIWQKNARSLIRVYFNLDLTGNQKFWFDTEDDEFHSKGISAEKHDEIVSEIMEQYNNYNIEKYQAFVTKIDDTKYNVSINNDGRKREIETNFECLLGEILTYFYTKSEMFFVHVNDIELGEKLYNEYQKNDFPATEFMLNSMILKHTAINNLRLVNMVVIVD